MPAKKDHNIEAVFLGLVNELRQAAKFEPTYRSEHEFELAVYKSLMLWAKANIPGRESNQVILTSHTDMPEYSEAAWKKFLGGDGPDIWTFDKRNRVDIVVHHPDGTIGIEIECLSPRERDHTRKLVSGLGQVVLTLGKRDRAMLVIHCGLVTTEHRAQLRELMEQISAGGRFAVVVAPEP